MYPDFLTDFEYQDGDNAYYVMITPRLYPPWHLNLPVSANFGGTLELLAIRLFWNVVAVLDGRHDVLVVRSCLDPFVFKWEVLHIVPGQSRAEAKANRENLSRNFNVAEWRSAATLTPREIQQARKFGAKEYGCKRE